MSTTGQPPQDTRPYDAPPAEPTRDTSTEPLQVAMPTGTADAASETFMDPGPAPYAGPDPYDAVPAGTPSGDPYAEPGGWATNPTAMAPQATAGPGAYPTAPYGRPTSQAYPDPYGQPSTPQTHGQASPYPPARAQADAAWGQSDPYGRPAYPAAPSDPMPGQSGQPPVGVPWRGCGPVDAVKRFFQGYVQFKGRASASEYWWAMGFIALVQLVLLPLSPLGIGILTNLANMAVMLPTIAVSMRRLHDTGRSGWWWAGPYAAQMLGGLLMAGGMVWRLMSGYTVTADGVKEAAPGMGGVILAVIGGLILLAGGGFSIWMMTRPAVDGPTMWDLTPSPAMGPMPGAYPQAPAQTMPRYGAAPTQAGMPSTPDPHPAYAPASTPYAAPHGSPHGTPAPTGPYGVPTSDSYAAPYGQAPYPPQGGYGPYGGGMA